MELLDAKNYAPVSLGRVAVLGLGSSGQAVVTYCCHLSQERVREVVVFAQENDDSRAFLQTLEDERVSIRFDEQPCSERFDLGIASPGISEFSDLYQQALRVCDELIGEVEFAWRESSTDALWVAVTGTNGKTTTTALLAHILQEAGKKAQAVGNIGDTCIEAVMQGDTDIFVAEVSSYQLASTRLFAPNIAVLLNITPDHLSWHKSFESYVAAKKNIYKNLGKTPPGVAILVATDEVIRAQIREIKSIPADKREFTYIPLGTARGLSTDMRKVCGSQASAYVNDAILTIDFEGQIHEVGRTSDLQIAGEHNHTNALAAASGAVALGIADTSIKSALSSFQPLEHRIEPCGVYQGVSFFNDSKATNIDATIKALSAFDVSKLILLLGGSDKGTDLSELHQATAGCKAVICFGSAGERLYEAVPSQGRSLFLTMEAALQHAQELARPGDVVLLSPACASFDEFDSFEHRGTVFKDLVASQGSGEA